MVVTHNDRLATRIDRVLEVFDGSANGTFLPEGAWGDVFAALDGEHLAYQGEAAGGYPAFGTRALPDYFTPSGLKPEGKAFRLWIDIIGCYLNAVKDGSLTASQAAHLETHLDPEPDAGNLMGGITPWRQWPDSGIMNLEHYLSKKGRAAYEAESYVQPAPCGEPEVLLLHLRSDSRIGSYWGDMYSLEVFLPRDDLKRGDFSRAHHRITNG